MAMIVAGIFVFTSPLTQFFYFSFFNGWSLSNFSWWLIEFVIAIYTLLMILPDENLQKVFLLASHYLQGITLVLFFLNMGIVYETVMAWIENVDFSSVFTTDYEKTV